MRLRNNVSVLLAVCLAVPVHGKDANSIVRASVAELPSILATYRTNVEYVEVQTDTGDILRWKAATVQEGFLQGAHASERVPVNGLRTVRVKQVFKSKTKRILAGIGGFLVGNIVGVTLATGLSDTYNDVDGAATALLIACPLAGAYFGRGLPRGLMQYVTIVLDRATEPEAMP